MYIFQQIVLFVELFTSMTILNTQKSVFFVVKPSGGGDGGLKLFFSIDFVRISFFRLSEGGKSPTCPIRLRPPSYSLLNKRSILGIKHEWCNIQVWDDVGGGPLEDPLDLRRQGPRLRHLLRLRRRQNVIPVREPNRLFCRRRWRHTVVWAGRARYARAHNVLLEGVARIVLARGAEFKGRIIDGVGSGGT